MRIIVAASFYSQFLLDQLLLPGFEIQADLQVAARL